MSGHSKWSTIKRKKGATDAKRSKVFTKFIKEITVSARIGGGDPNANPRLRRVVDAARAGNMPNDTIARAIKKGTGELEGVTYEELMYEGVGPAGTLIVVEVMTDNRNRTNPELRKIFDVNNGQLGAQGSAAWAFDQKGVISLARDAVSEEKLFELAVGAGADDVEDAGDQWLVTTDKTALDEVSKALEAAGLKLESAELEQIPKTKKEIEGRDAEVLLNLIEALEDHDDVQKVATDTELSEAELQRLSQ